MKKADIGLIGLAVMGENLAMNMESKGFTVAVFNRETEIVDKFINGRGKNKNFLNIVLVDLIIITLGTEGSVKTLRSIIYYFSTIVYG